MTQLTTDEREKIQSDLDTTDTLRFKNLKKAVYLMAENEFLKTIIIGLSSKSIDSILQEGRSIIRANSRITEERCQAVEKMKDHLF